MLNAKYLLNHSCDRNFFRQRWQEGKDRRKIEIRLTFDIFVQNISVVFEVQVPINCFVRDLYLHSIETKIHFQRDLLLFVICIVYNQLVFNIILIRYQLKK